jgi:hypothetical protein
MLTIKKMILIYRQHHGRLLVVKHRQLARQVGAFNTIDQELYGFWPHDLPNGISLYHQIIGLRGIHEGNL